MAFSKAIYTDTFDRDRQVRIVGETKDRHSYRVEVRWRSSFKTKGPDGNELLKERWDSGGFTVLPKSLFFDNEGTWQSRIGFILCSSNQRPVAKEFKRYDRQDRYEREERYDRRSFR